ncbi:MAG: LytTR family DNA-binding domain-containing protein [Lachnospiraceae bacterium]|nr:LytTR family DNA-binding domain-containing protein [Lachnospiraceae bacterium]
MIKIAVVDDEKRERDDLSRFFNKLQKKINEELDIHLFESGEEFLSACIKNYDLICMDIDMKGMNGIETAKIVRKADTEVMIIFITNMAQMAIRGYEVNAVDFILKPVNYYSFAMKVQNVFDIIKNRKTRNIVINTLNGMVKISSNNLYYIEVNAHYLFYHTSSGIYKQKASLKDLELKLDGLSFKRCNNCYLINLKYVDCVNKDDLRINGEWLKISRPRKKEFLQSLANYMGGINI